jgi:hypothetical protein
VSGVRPPRFAGITGGVGTSTLAGALHGVYSGRYAGGPVDVLVCRVGSLSTAARLGGPVLAVVADRAPRLDRLGSGFGAVVTVPEIAAWRELDAPDLAGLLGVAPQRRSARLQPYVDALLEITAALLRSGVLQRPPRRSFAQPGPARPVEVGRPRHPVVTAPTRARPVPVAPAPVTPGAAVAARTAVARVAAAPVVPTPVVVPVPAVPTVGAPLVATPPLWRGLLAVERVPAPARTTLAAGLDDDAVESAGVG